MEQIGKIRCLTKVIMKNQSAKHTLSLLLLLSVFIFACNVYSQTQIVCNGEKITIDDKTTFVSTSKSHGGWTLGVINGKAVHIPTPEYPKETIEKELRETVNVSVLIDEKGDVIAARAVSENEIFRNSAEEAAKKAKFKKMIRNCEPHKYTGIVQFKFTKGMNEIKKPKLIDVGDVTEKAIFLPQPRVSFNVDFPENEIVRVRVLIDVLKGDVIEAKAISGFPNLRIFAEESAQCARFLPTNDVPVEAKAEGYIEFKFDKSNKSPGIVNGGVLNDRATIFPKPQVPANINAFGSVTVRVNLDEKGNVISAKAVSGNVCLGEAAVQAARKAKFKQTLLSGVSVKVAGIIVYNFPENQK